MEASKEQRKSLKVFKSQTFKSHFGLKAREQIPQHGAHLRQVKVTPCEPPRAAHKPLLAACGGAAPGGPTRPQLKLLPRTLNVKRSNDSKTRVNTTTILP